MAAKTLSVDLSEGLYFRFIEIVTQEVGHWRGKETFTEAVESAVTAALMLFIRNLDGQAKLPDLNGWEQVGCFGSNNIYMKNELRRVA